MHICCWNSDAYFSEIRLVREVSDSAVRILQQKPAGQKIFSKKMRIFAFSLNVRNKHAIVYV